MEKLPTDTNRPSTQPPVPETPQTSSTVKPTKPTRTLYQMKVAAIRDHTPCIRELELRAVEPASFRFRAGQFVMLHVPQEPKPALRAYSIASDERDETGFKLIFKFVPEGVASKFVWSLRGGETLTFTGPFGKLFFLEPPTEQVIFLNTGSGIAQHISYLLSKATQFPEKRYRLLFGVRHETDIYFEKELNELRQTLSDFDFSYVLSRPSERWAGKRGYVQNFTPEFGYHQTETTFYLCGNGGMIRDVKRQLVEVEGFNPRRIIAEAFD